MPGIIIDTLICEYDERLEAFPLMLQEQEFLLYPFQVTWQVITNDSNLTVHH